MDENLMLKFLNDRSHLKLLKNYVSYSIEGRPHLLIAHPAILATFMGYLKFQIRTSYENKEVFFRGQVNNHSHIIPSLLRGDDLEKTNILSEAYSTLKSRTQNLFKASRFKNETIDNFFQHYGIKSKTLDLVDNIFIAIWFATNRWKIIPGFDNLCTYEQSKEEFGWIYFMLVEPPEKNKSLSSPSFSGYCDLRKYHYRLV